MISSSTFLRSMSVSFEPVVEAVRRQYQLLSEDSIAIDSATVVPAEQRARAETIDVPLRGFVAIYLMVGVVERAIRADSGKSLSKLDRTRARELVALYDAVRPALSLAPSNLLSSTRRHGRSGILVLILLRHARKLVEVLRSVTGEERRRAQHIANLYESAADTTTHVATEADDYLELTSEQIRNRAW